MNFKNSLKKIFSLLAVIIILSGFSITANAYTVASPESTEVVYQLTKPAVNGQLSANITYRYDSEDKNIVTFFYDGEGTLKGWNIIDSKGKTYTFEELANAIEIIDQGDDYIQVRILDASLFAEPDGYRVNAIVAGVETPSHVERDDKSKSPNTGADISNNEVKKFMFLSIGVPMLLLLSLLSYLGIRRFIYLKR